jgi:antirestriction protein ArdC
MALREDITNAIVRLIESGAAAGSFSPLWDAAVSCGMPLNYATRTPYSGINVPLLWGATLERGFDKSEWLTFKQALALDAHVRKGAKGVLCAFFKRLPRDGGNDDAATSDEAAAGGKSFVPMLKPFWVFNVAEIDGLPSATSTAPAVPTAPFDPIARAETLLERFGVPITWEGMRAFYRPATDEIVMPSRERFSSPVNAYAVALHEATHATGHPSRLAREFGKRFGDAAYAFEELVAELGSAMLVAHLGLPGACLEHHASYVESWLRVLRSDASAIFTASRHASAAFQLIAGTAADAEVDAQPVEPSPLALAA